MFCPKPYSDAYAKLTVVLASTDAVVLRRMDPRKVLHRN